MTVNRSPDTDAPNIAGPRFVTITNGDLRFEIPARQLESARASGFRELSSDTEVLVFDAENLRNRNEQHSVPNLPVQVLTIDEIGEVDRRVEESQLEREREIAEASLGRRFWLRGRYWIQDHQHRLLRQIGGNGFSVLLHLAILLILASLALVNEQPEELLITALSSSDNTVVEEVVLDSVPLEITEPSEEAQSEAPPKAEMVAIEVPVETPDFMGAVSGDAVKPPEMASPETGKDGDAEPMRKPTFFGSSMAAINYVFVIDNSNSMTRGRFETAIYELTLTLNRLTPRQRFYIIFYSDTAYPMMHPSPATSLVPATQRNKQRVFQWLQTVQLCLKTQGRKALQAAFDLDPDVIYVLGDGAFTDRAADYFAARPHDRIIVHTRGMEVQPKDAEAFRKLAEANRGTYKDVGVNPLGAQRARQFPIKRNSIRGPVWGITLPVNKK